MPGLHRGRDPASKNKTNTNPKFKSVKGTLLTGMQTKQWKEDIGGRGRSGWKFSKYSGNQILKCFSKGGGSAYLQFQYLGGKSFSQKQVKGLKQDTNIKSKFQEIGSGALQTAAHFLNVKTDEKDSANLTNDSGSHGSTLWARGRGSTCWLTELEEEQGGDAEEKHRKNGYEGQGTILLSHWHIVQFHWQNLMKSPGYAFKAQLIRFLL